MMRTMLLCAALLAVPIAAPCPAQSTIALDVTGVVQPVPGPTICMQGETHLLECAQVFLRSNVVDLNALVGQNVRLTGVDIGVTCTVIEVLAAVPADTTLEWCGTPAPGCAVKFKVCPGGMALALLFASTSPGFFPVFLPLNGTPEAVLLSPPFIPIPLALGTTGCFDSTIPIPPDLSQVGADVWLQGARMDIGPAGAMHLTNSICLTIVPPLPFCLVPGC